MNYPYTPRHMALKDISEYIKDRYGFYGTKYIHKWVVTASRLAKSKEIGRLNIKLGLVGINRMGDKNGAVKMMKLRNKVNDR